MNLFPFSPVSNVPDCRYASVTADPGVVSLIRVWSNNFVDIGHEIISKAIVVPSPDSRRVVVSSS